MNILIVSHGIPSAEDPQWGSFELDQARALQNLGHKVTIAAIDGRFRKHRKQKGIIVSSFGSIRAYLYYLLPYKVLLFSSLKRKARTKMMKDLFETIKEKEGIPDIIYAHYLFSISSLDDVHKVYPQIPIVGIEHWSMLSEKKISTYNTIRGRIGYGLVNRLLSVSPSLQAQIKKHFGKDSEVVYDMIDDVFLETSINLNKSRNPFRFVSVGSLNEGKGFDVLIQAFSRISDRDAELVIIGDGAIKESLVRLIQELSLQGRVLLKGRLSHDEIVAHLSEADAYVLSSRSETFGVSYVEAMAMGLPAIATRCGGPESFMNDDCGIMVDVDDVDGLVAAMNRMEEHIDDYSPLAIREYVRSRFSGEVIAKQLESIFEEEIKAKRA